MTTPSLRRCLIELQEASMTVASETRIVVEQVPIDDLRPDPANPRRIRTPNWRPSPGALESSALWTPSSPDTMTEW